MNITLNATFQDGIYIFICPKSSWLLKNTLYTLYVIDKKLSDDNMYIENADDDISIEEEEEEPGAVSKKRARLHSSNERNQKASSVEHPALK